MILHRKNSDILLLSYDIESLLLDYDMTIVIFSKIFFSVLSNFYTEKQVIELESREKILESNKI